MAVLGVFFVIFRMFVGNVSKYFQEINRGIDSLVNEDAQDIALSAELASTERKINSIRRTLTKRKTNTELAEQRKNDLVMYLAHDLKTPLSSVIGYLTLLRDEGQVSGSEVGCAVLGTGTDLIVGEVDQISLKHGFFKIHQEAQPEKGAENATIKVPANLPAKVRERIQETAKKIYRTLGCRGLARIDLFLRKDGQIVLNEVNTMPGFTSYSRYPRMMTAAGFTLSELIDRLIELALRR